MQFRMTFWRVEGPRELEKEKQVDELRGARAICPDSRFVFVLTSVREHGRGLGKTMEVGDGA